MPRTPRNPGTGKAPVNTPAQGAGHGGPAAGRGWGGPAQGAHVSAESIQTAPEFAEGNPGSPVHWPDSERKRLKKLVAREMEGIIADVARDTREPGMSRASAAEKLHKIYRPQATRVKNEHTGKNGAPIEVANKSPLDAARAVAFLLAQGARAAADET